MPPSEEPLETIEGSQSKIVEDVMKSVPSRSKRNADFILNAMSQNTRQPLGIIKGNIFLMGRQCEDHIWLI